MLPMPPTIAVVSPHLDDAGLSVGGLLWLLRNHYRVVVITVFTADPPEAVSPVAAELAGPFGPTISAVRRAEDMRALETLGVGHRHLGFQDAVHRRTAQGAWLVKKEADLFRATPDETLVEQVAVTLTECLEPEPVAGLLSPAGIGNHVDHLVTAAAVARISGSGVDHLAWIDLPYGANQRRTEPRLRVPLPAAAWRAKVAAVGCYESQLADLYPGYADWDRMMLPPDGPAEWFAVPALHAEPELLPLFEELLNWYAPRT